MANFSDEKPRVKPPSVMANFSDEKPRVKPPSVKGNFSTNKNETNLVRPGSAVAMLNKK
jgi:hypothetical protein